MRDRILVAFGAVSAALLLVAAMAIPAQVQAQDQATNGNGLRIAPVRLDLTIKPGETKTVDVYVTNVTDKPAQLKAIINDFGPSDDETGQPRVYLDEKVSAPAHGLKKFVKPVDSVSLQPQERRAVKVTIAMPVDAAGGGYFGVVRFAPASVDSRENVTLSGSVGTLLLVTVPGDIVERASIRSLNIARLNGDQPGKASNFFTNGAKDGNGKGLQAVVRVQNSGNVQIAPFGKAILKKNGREVGTYELNATTPRGVVLPDSTRRFMVDLGDKTASLGKYSLEGNFGYGTSGQLITARTSFYVVPLPYVLVAVALLVLLAAAIFLAPRWLKAHDRKLIRKLRRGKRS